MERQRDFGVGYSAIFGVGTDISAAYAAHFRRANLPRTFSG